MVFIDGLSFYTGGRQEGLTVLLPFKPVSAVVVHRGCNIFSGLYISSMMYTYMCNCYWLGCNQVLKLKVHLVYGISAILDLDGGRIVKIVNNVLESLKNHLFLS